VSLETEIREWDQKSVAAIAAIHAAHAADADLIDQLLSLAGETELETGATWLIKHQLENRLAQLDLAQTLKLVALLSQLSGWEARLHCLQIFPFITLPREGRDLILRFVLDCSKDDNKFVRAWAYSGLHQLALAHPEYREQARVILETAQESERAASVKVRLRRALKQGFPDTDN
tara:strand:- start:27483 stop:28007 length:525 start_codon:yes stop_codon:yes gene_type:complete